jgi:hypothetical protein
MNVGGEEGTEVTLTVQSPNEKPRDLTITRMLFTSYPLNGQKTYFRLEGQPEEAYLQIKPALASQLVSLPCIIDSIDLEANEHSTRESCLNE